MKWEYTKYIPPLLDISIDERDAREGHDSHLRGASIIWMHLYTQFTLEKVRLELKKFLSKNKSVPAQSMFSAMVSWAHHMMLFPVMVRWAWLVSVFCYVVVKLYEGKCSNSNVSLDSDKNLNTATIKKNLCTNKSTVHKLPLVILWLNSNFHLYQSSYYHGCKHIQIYI